MALVEAVRREAIYITSILRTLYRLRAVKPSSPSTITDIVEGFARRTPQAPAIFCEDQVVSYAALDAAANRYANWAATQGIARGDVVSLLMDNRPEYLIAWLGLLKLGAIVALINTNLRGPPLAHSLNVASAKHLVLGAELGEPLAEVLPLLERRPVAWATGGLVPGAQDLDAALAASSQAPPDPAIRRGLTCRDKAFYIFTSGTTGMPKAANITHLRMLFMMYGFAGGLNSKPTDRIYDPLPLYHSSGGICAVGVAFTAGGAVIVRRRFSVQEFWDDCRKYDATLFQYIGEICRYLLNAPPHAHERDHRLRAIIGNGLRPEIWPAFQKRFAIPRIVEFYGATEGNVSMLNYDGKVGAIGRVPNYMRWRFRYRIIRFDIEKETPVRGADGFCIECPPGEAGEAIGEIKNEPGMTFEGYTQEADTRKKILHDVFRKGDAWFRTGDLLKRDEHGYFYFVDRIGDTFRWKGENVATSEVAEAFGVVPGVREANVYGVAVPGMDGRAGMAALVADAGLDRAILATRLAANLPAYARPVFLRLRPEMEITGTFKQRKIDLVNDGFDPSRISDPLFVMDAATGQYIPLDAALYGDIVNGRVKL